MAARVASAAVNPFTHGRWVMEPKPQNVWGRNHATWFYAMGLGGALFIVRGVSGLDMGRLVGVSVADLLSLGVIGIGGLVLLGALGTARHGERGAAHQDHHGHGDGEVKQVVAHRTDLLRCSPRSHRTPWRALAAVCVCLVGVHEENLRGGVVNVRAAA